LTSFADLRDLGENIGRVASIREKAESPMDRVVIQVKDKVLKVVAGNFHTTMVYTVGDVTLPDGKAVVGSRLFLQTLKTLKGKGEANIFPTDKGAAIVTSFGSRIDMDNVAGSYKFLIPLPYKKDTAPLVPFPAGFLPQATKYLYATADYAPFEQVLFEAKDGALWLRSSDDHTVGEVGPLPTDHKFKSTLYPEAFQSLRGIEGAGGFWFPPRVGPQVQQMQVISGPFRVATVVRLEYGKFPSVAGGKYACVVKADRKLLVDTFKSLAGRHQYSRVIMEAKGGQFTIKAGDNGAASVVAEVEGEAFIPVNATFMAKTLATVDGKTATVEFSDAPSNIRVTGDTPWPLVVAPMK
jgi:DNA polymerase III sliding clamp (beta) subunit (PCNA family)